MFIKVDLEEGQSGPRALYFTHFKKFLDICYSLIPLNEILH